MSQYILITGGAHGLGLALAKVHARRGEQIFILDINPENGQQAVKTLNALGGHSRFIQTDLTSAQACRQAIDEVISTWSHIDRLYNNAGIAGRICKLEQQQDEDWQQVFELNLFAQARLTRLLLPQLRQSAKAHVTNIASMAGLLCGSHTSIYSASKAAVIALSEVLQQELGKEKIGVTVACPAFFQTALAQSIPKQDAKARLAVEKLMQRSPLNADEVATIIIEASDQGQFLCLPHRRERWMWYLKRLHPGALYSLMRKL